MTKGQKALARKLRTSRVRAGVALQALAAFCGIDFSLISKYERGERPLSQEVFDRLIGAIPTVAGQERAKEHINELFRKLLSVNTEEKVGAVLATMSDAEKAAVWDVLREHISEERRQALKLDMLFGPGAGFAIVDPKKLEAELALLQEERKQLGARSAQQYALRLEKLSRDELLSLFANVLVQYDTLAAKHALLEQDRDGFKELYLAECQKKKEG